MIKRTRYQLFTEGHEIISEEDGKLVTRRGKTLSTWKQLSSNTWQRIACVAEVAAAVAIEV